MTTATFDNLPHSSRASRADFPGQSEPARSPALRAILARHDDRLLRDVGLTREDVVGPAETFWTEWRRTRETWSL